MAYRVDIHRVAQKQLLSFPREAQIEIAKAIDELESNARPAGCKKLGETGLWQVKVGRYRIAYSIDKARAVTVVKVCQKQESNPSS